MKHLFVGTTRNPHVQFLRYLFVGGTSAVVDLAAYTLLFKLLEMNYLLAAFFGYMAGLAWNHFLSVVWVFESKHSRRKEILMVFLIALGGLFWTEVILYGLVDFMHMDEIVAKMISQVIVLGWNFTMRKLYVFH